MFWAIIARSPQPVAEFLVFVILCVFIAGLCIRLCCVQLKHVGHVFFKSGVADFLICLCFCLLAFFLEL